MTLSGTLTALPDAAILQTVTAYAEDSTQEPNFHGLKYAVNSTPLAGTEGPYVEIYGYNDDMDYDIILPAEIDGVPVRRIRSSALSGCPYLHSIVIPDGVMIASRAFQNCINLESVTLPSDLQTLESETFSGCESLAEIRIPDSVSKITGNVFLNCSSLKKVTMPNNPELTTVSDRLFSGCSVLEPVEVPASLANDPATLYFGGFDRDYLVLDHYTTVPSTAPLSSFSKLTQIVVPENVTSIETRCMQNCKMLQRITFLNPDCEIRWQSGDVNYNVGIEGYALSTAENYTTQTGKRLTSIIDNTPAAPMHYQNPDALSCLNFFPRADYASVGRIHEPVSYVSEITIPESYNGLPVTQISLGSAPGSSLPVINISKTVTAINISNFSGNFELTAINVDPDNPNYSSVDGVLYNKDQTELLFYPPAKRGCVFTVPETVEKIGDKAFDNNRYIGFVQVPSSVKELGSYAFSNMKALVDLDLSAMEDAVIGSNAAGNNRRLAKLSLPETISQIPSGFCSGDSKLRTISIPDSVTSIGSSAFNDCRIMTISHMSEQLEVLESYAFSTCSAITEIVLPETLKEIQSGAFSSNTKLERITILNPNCTIYDADDTISSSYGFNPDTQRFGNHFDGTICGYTGSTAENYAETYGCTFESIGEMPETTETTTETTASETVDTTTETVLTTTESAAETVDTTTSQPTTDTVTDTTGAVTTTAAPTTTKATTTTAAPTTTKATTTTAEGFRPARRHLMSRNFSAPRSDHNRHDNRNNAHPDRNGRQGRCKLRRCCQPRGCSAHAQRLYRRHGRQRFRSQRPAKESG